MELNFVKENSRKTADKAIWWYELVNCSEEIVPVSYSIKISILLIKNTQKENIIMT